MSNSFFLNCFVETKDINELNIKKIYDEISLSNSLKNNKVIVEISSNTIYTSLVSSSMSGSINFLITEKKLSSLDLYLHSFLNIDKYDIIKILKETIGCFDINYVKFSRDPEMKKDYDGLANMEMALHIDGSKGKLMRHIKNDKQ